jgi:hypothetical protein
VPKFQVRLLLVKQPVERKLPDNIISDLERTLRNAGWSELFPISGELVPFYYKGERHSRTGEEFLITLSPNGRFETFRQARKMVELILETVFGKAEYQKVIKIDSIRKVIPVVKLTREEISRGYFTQEASIFCLSCKNEVDDVVHIISPDAKHEYFVCPICLSKGEGINSDEIAAEYLRARKN